MSSSSNHDLESSTCRILTVSSTLRCAIDLVDRIKATPSDAEIVRSGLGESCRIRWTISNRYYSADVHFQAHTVSGLAPHHVRNVPAVIFVWPKGEAYQHHIQRFAGDMAGYEPEVSLAVRVAPSSDIPVDAEDEQQDDADIDEFLSSNGFEFIDGSNEESPHSPFAEGIPGLPRVYDALSTIMWPSMQTRSRVSTTRLHQDFDWADTTQDEMPDLGASRSRQEEIAELTRWLEEDTNNDSNARDDPWRTAADSMSVSPTALGSTEFPEGAKEFGFDDDFTVFISAPPVEQDKDKDQDVDSDSDFEESPARLGLPGSSPLYLSLGSGLDLREIEEGDKEDDDMPTEAEIDAMSTRIFGGPMREEAVSSDSNDGFAAFDLTRVMSALEGMKAEIANMEDEGEKRKVAASVAISLVYGLQGEGS
ncbi:hypothetical protein MIND_00848500 [Mycena indigotica]|uniref:Uncharacterized protein n=1 Tax=Mycena indigotica TaxID=2126181 RepID=A0A8H6SHE2_9AGAR|nr:uncharacterized protein MIND_00848500 [Mycena indigotica]KAF7299003.1 hypothetical protein MIND_00848500 [Mycena indigotica]